MSDEERYERAASTSGKSGDMSDPELKGIVVTSGNSIRIVGYRGDWTQFRDALMLMMGGLLARRDQCDGAVTIEFTFKHTDKLRMAARSGAWGRNARGRWRREG